MRKRTSPIWDLDRETLKELVEKADAITDILWCFGLPNRGKNYLTLKTRLEIEGIPYPDTSFTNRKKHPKRYTKPLDELLVKDSNSGSSKLKKRLVEEHVLVDVCSICGQKPIWNGKPLVLELDHINGDYKDNRLENLRILCPHCHSQTDSFRGRSKRTYRLTKEQIKENALKVIEECSNIPQQEVLIYKCLQCNKPYQSEHTKQKYCSSECVHLSQRRTKHPSKERLQKLVWEKPTCQLAKDFGVSDKSIEKWCKKYNIEKPPRGYWQKKLATENI